MQPSLIIVGLSYPGSPVAVRERFWLDAARRLDALVQLGAAEGIEEIAVLVNADRTEFIIWASDLSLAASSVLTYLTGEHGLRLCEWKNFYRLVDETALAHLLRVASGLESRFSSGTEIMDDLRSALEFAVKTGATGPHLETVFDNILQAAVRMRQKTGIGFPKNVPLHAALDIATQKLGNLAGRNILVLAAEAEPSLHEAAQCADITVLSRLPGRAPAFGDGSDAKTVCFEQCWQEMAETDVVVHLSSGPCFTVSREQARTIANRRNGAPLHIFDLAVPRGVDPAVEGEAGFVLYNIDELREAWETAAGSAQAEDRAQQMLAGETKIILSKLHSAPLSPSSAIGYGRIKELCREVANKYSAEVAASEEQARAIEGVSTRIASRISSYLSAEQSGRKKQTIMSAVRRLFQENGRPNAVRPEN